MFFKQNSWQAVSISYFWVESNAFHVFWSKVNVITEWCEIFYDIRTVIYTSFSETSLLFGCLLLKMNFMGNNHNAVRF